MPYGAHARMNNTISLELKLSGYWCVKKQERFALSFTHLSSESAEHAEGEETSKKVPYLFFFYIYIVLNINMPYRRAKQSFLHTFNTTCTPFYLSFLS